MGKFTPFGLLNIRFYQEVLFFELRFLTAFILDFVTYASQLVFLSMLFFSNFGTSLKILFIVIGFCFLFSSFIGFIFIGKLKFSAKETKRNFLENLNFSSWLIASSILQWIAGGYHLIVGGIILGPIAVGAVKAAQNIMGVFNVLFLGLENFVPVQASTIFDKLGLKGLTTYLYKLTQSGIIISIPIFIFFLLFADKILSIIYGEAFSDYGYLLNYFLIIYVFIFAGFAFRYFFRTIENTRVIFGAYLLSSVFSLLTASYFVQYFNVIGILIGMLLSQVIMIVFYVWKFREIDNQVKKA